MAGYDGVRAQLKEVPKRWLITGVAGFIGSNLLETLLDLNQHVIGIDNFITGHPHNLEEVRAQVTPESWKKFRFVEGDLADRDLCALLTAEVDFVLHQAALGSVPRSISEPIETHQHNVAGFLNIILAAKDAGVKRFVFASSSAVYGDETELPKVENRTGKPLSPYAATKAMNELYADAFARAYGFGSIGLRYFNVFGPRQDPSGAYAAVIPHWISALLKGDPVFINGDGETSRDFCFVADVVQANLLAAVTDPSAALSEVFNVACGKSITLKQLFYLLQDLLRRRQPSLAERHPIHRAFRPGDVRHSLADITKARNVLGYVPAHDIKTGLELAMTWYQKRFS